MVEILLWVGLGATIGTFLTIRILSNKELRNQYFIK